MKFLFIFNNSYFVNPKMIKPPHYTPTMGELSNVTKSMVSSSLSNNTKNMVEGTIVKEYVSFVSFVSFYIFGDY